MSQTDNVVNSGRWVFARIFISNVSKIFVVAVLARRLDPADFGVVALALVVFQLLTLLGTEGVSQFVIHDTKDGREERCQAVFWMDMLFACLSMSLGFVLIPYLVVFFENPQLGVILSVILLVAPINSIARVPDALLRKEFRFKPVEIRDLLIALGTGVMSVAMVLLGYGVWSLVVPGLVGAVVKVIAVYGISEWRPGLKLHLSLWPRVFSFYKNIVGVATTSFVVTHGDTALVGKVFGAAMLGYYNVAWQGANLVNNLIVKIGNQIALPTFARVGDGPESTAEKGEYLRKAIRILAGFTFPMFVVLFVLTDLFILTIFGEKWEPSIAPMRVLLVYALRYAMSPPIGAFFFAIARPEIMFRLGLLTLPLYLAGIFIGSKFGILGVAIAVAFVRTGSGLVGFAVAARFLDMSFLKFVQPTLPPLTAALISGVALHAIKTIITPDWLGGGLGSLIFFVVLGAVLYWLLVRLFFRTVFEDLCQLVSKVAGPKFGWIVRLMRFGEKA